MNTRFFGWFSQSHRETYDKIANECKSGDKILEIGALFGKSTTYLADKIRHKDIEFYVVDLWDIHIKKKYVDMFQKKYGNDMYKVFQENLKKHNLHKLLDSSVKLKIIPLKMSSDDAFTFFLNSDIKFDYIYIDGDHSYEQVLKDIRGAEKTIMPGGMIAGDDWIKPGVKKVLKEHYADRFKLFGEKNPSWILN